MSTAQPWWFVALCWAVGAGLAFLAVRALDRRGDDRLLGALAVVTGCVCVWNLMHGVGPLGIALVWCVCVVLDAAVCIELRTRRVPPLLVLPVTVFAVAIDVHSGDWTALAVGTTIGACFGFAWLRTRGRASGLGDAQLAALAGLTLGLELGTIVVAAACLAAAGISFARNERGIVAFAPYLAATIQCALLFPALT